MTLGVRKLIVLALVAALFLLANGPWRKSIYVGGAFALELNRMELPRRPRGDELLRPGELTDIRRRLRNIAGSHDVTTVIACAFDHRTRMLPFTYADMRMVPAGVRAIGSAMVDA